MKNLIMTICLLIPLYLPGQGLPVIGSHLNVVDSLVRVYPTLKKRVHSNNAFGAIILYFPEGTVDGRSELMFYEAYFFNPWTNIINGVVFNVTKAEAEALWLKRIENGDEVQKDGSYYDKGKSIYYKMSFLGGAWILFTSDAYKEPHLDNTFISFMEKFYIKVYKKFYTIPDLSKEENVDKFVFLE